MLQVTIETEDKKIIPFPALHDHMPPASLTDYAPNGTYILMFGVVGENAFLIVPKQRIHIDRSDGMREVISYEKEFEKVIARGETYKRDLKMKNGQLATLLLENI